MMEEMLPYFRFQLGLLLLVQAIHSDLTSATF